MHSLLGTVTLQRGSWLSFLGEPFVSQSHPFGTQALLFSCLNLLTPLGWTSLSTCPWSFASGCYEAASGGCPCVGCPCVGCPFWG